MKPALLLDVDGPLNPYQANPYRRPAGYSTFRYTPAGVSRSMRVWLNKEHGPAFRQLEDKFDLWWATAWEHRANSWIASRVGLPRLPVVEFGPRPPRPVPELDVGRGIFWKTEAIAQAMVGRFFVWIDDDVTTADSEYLEARHAAGSLIYRVDPAVGLLPEDFERIASYADGATRGIVDGPTRREMADRAKRERQRKAKKDFERATGIHVPDDVTIRSGSAPRALGTAESD